MASPWERMKAKQSALPSGYKGPQPGGITSVAPSARATYYSDPVEKMRGKYFDDRQDVSRDRLERRLAQQQENIFNRLTMFKPVEGTGGTLLQSRTPGGPSIADVYEASALKYGPTPSELLSDIKYGAGNLFKGLGNFVTSGGLTGALFRGVKDLLTNPVGTAKNMYYGAKDMMKGYNPLTQQGMGVTPEIKSEPLPSLDLEAKMSAYTDPSAYYASLQEQKPKGDYLQKQDQYYYQNKPQSSPTGDQYYYADASKKDIKTIAPFRDAGMSYGDVMNNFGSVIDNLRQKNPSLTDDDIKGILDGTITKPTGQFAQSTLQDPYALLRGQNNQTMIFNRGGRVRGTGIMGAL